MLTAVLLAALHVGLTVRNGTITLAWDPPEAGADIVSGYVALTGPVNPEAGECQGDWTDQRDVGNVLQFTYPDGVVDITKPTCFGVLAYTSFLKSDPAVLLYDPTTQPPPPPPDPCAQPLGTKAIGLFAGRAIGTSGSVGSRVNLQFQVSSPGAPVVQLWVWNGTETSPPIKGEQLVDVGSMWFRAPMTPGTYNVGLTAVNAAGCTGTLLKGADGKPLTITVK